MPALEPSEKNMAVANEIVNQTKLTGYVTMKYAIAQELEARDYQMEKAIREKEHIIQELQVETDRHSERLVGIYDYMAELKEVLECFKPFVTGEKWKIEAALKGQVSCEVVVRFDHLEVIQKLLNGGKKK